MKLRMLLSVTTALILPCISVKAADTATPRPLRLVMHWDHQSQFAGYYMALDKGFYAEEGLDVSIIRGGPDVRSCETVAEGGAEFCVSMLSTAIEKRALGLPMVGIAQVVNRCNFQVVAWKKPDAVKGVVIQRPDQLSGRKVTVWEEDFRLPYEAFFESTGASPKLVPQYYTLSLFMNRGVDACATMHYNEYHWLLQHGVQEEDITVFPLWQYGVDLPEDGIYTTEEFLRENPALCRAFVRATLRGWEYARDYREETLDSVMQRVNEAKLPTNRPHMSWMLNVILESIFPPTEDSWTFGKLNKRQYERASRILLRHGSLKSVPAYDSFIIMEEAADVESR